MPEAAPEAVPELAAATDEFTEEPVAAEPVEADTILEDEEDEALPLTVEEEARNEE